VIELRRARIVRMLGAELPDREVEEILRSLGFGVEASEAGWQLQNPSWRRDVAREIDVIEELARIFGYDRFESRLPESGAGIELVPHAEEYARLRATSRALGYDETVSLSFVSSEEAERFGAWPAVALRNPLTEVQTAMRNSAVPAMLHAIEWNVNRNESNARLAELGRVYRGGNGSYEEPHVMILGATGMARAPRLGDPGKPLDFYDIKSDVAALLAPFDLHGLTFSAHNLPPYYAPGHAAQLTAGGVLLGYVGELDTGLLRERKVKQPVFLAEIFLDPLYEAGLRRPQYRALARVPAVDRDFSLFVPEGVSFDEVAAAIGPMEFLVSVEPIEIFRGEQVPGGFYSLLLRASWQRGQVSLTDEEVNGYAAAVTESLRNKLGIKQRV
jgi:phenylalanyl-tRNA synthetase beta chain